MLILVDHIQRDVLGLDLERLRGRHLHVYDLAAGDHLRFLGLLAIDLDQPLGNKSHTAGTGETKTPNQKPVQSVLNALFYDQTVSLSSPGVRDNPPLL
jgi:hypothetical protein